MYEEHNKIIAPELDLLYKNNCTNSISYQERKDWEHSNSTAVSWIQSAFFPELAFDLPLDQLWVVSVGFSIVTSVVITEPIIIMVKTAIWLYIFPIFLGIYWLLCCGCCKDERQVRRKGKNLQSDDMYAFFQGSLDSQTDLFAKMDDLDTDKLEEALEDNIEELEMANMQREEANKRASMRKDSIILSKRPTITDVRELMAVQAGNQKRLSAANVFNETAGGPGMVTAGLEAKPESSVGQKYEV